VAGAHPDAWLVEARARRTEVALVVPEQQLVVAQRDDLGSAHTASSLRM
jgi:hypothetical protein